MTFIPAKNTAYDSTTRGPARWERAARNALLRPHSAAAQLYRKRYDMALSVSESIVATGGKEQPWQFMGYRVQYYRDPVTRKMEWESKRCRKYATCSTFCTVMQVTLDFDASTLRQVAEAYLSKSLDGEPRLLPLRKGDAKRTMRCQVCGTQIKV